MYMQDFLHNLLMGRFFSEETASVDFLANNTRVYGSLSACMKTSSLGNLVQNLAFASWNIFSRSNYVYSITVTTNKLFNAF